MFDKFMMWFLFNDYSVIVLAVISFVIFSILKIKKKEKEKEQDQLAKKIAKEILLAEEKKKNKF